MEIYQLELFLAVVSAGGLTRAARERGLSAGAMSQQIQRLSVELGVPLFQKSGRGIALTPEGLQFAERTRALLRDVDDLRRCFTRDASSDRSPFHLATGATTLIHGLGKPLRALRRKYPQAAIRVTAANTEEMVEGLLSRRFDLAIVSLPLDDDRLSIAPLYDEELLVLRPSEEPIHAWRVGAIAPRDLAGLPFLLYPKGTNMRQIIDTHLDRFDVLPEVAMEAADTEVIVRLVEAGFGQSILPANALRRSPRHFRVVRIAGGKLFRQQAVATLRASSRPLTMAITQFLIDNLG